MGCASQVQGWKIYAPSCWDCWQPTALSCQPTLGTAWNKSTCHAQGHSLSPSSQHPMAGPQEDKQGQLFAWTQDHFQELPSSGLSVGWGTRHLCCSTAPARPIPLPHPHPSCWSPGHSLRNFLCANLSVRFCRTQPATGPQILRLQEKEPTMGIKQRLWLPWNYRKACVGNHVQHNCFNQHLRE